MKNKPFVNEQKISTESIAEFIKSYDKAELISLATLQGSLIYEVADILSEKELDYLLKLCKESEWIPVGLDGIKENYTTGDRIGSKRLSVFSKEISSILTERLKDIVPEIKYCDSKTPVESDNHREWKFVGVNPLLRFIKYTTEGKLVPHYDRSYIANDNERTLVSLVICLSKGKGGETRFIQDSQTHLPMAERDLSDWEETNLDEDKIELDYVLEPKNALLFDHALLHDSNELVDGTKIIIRTDLIFKKQ